MGKRNIFDLSGKDIWVFGGAGYIGSAVVSLLADLGCSILCVDREQRAHDFVMRSKLDQMVTPLSLDKADMQAVRDEITRQVETRGIPFGLVDLTFSSTSKAFDDLDEHDMLLVHQGGVASTLSMVREIGNQMASTGKGSIILFSSMYGMVSPYPDIYKAPMNRNPVEYGIDKAAIGQLTRYLAVHWGRQNIRCNSVSPGPMPNLNVQSSYPDFIERLCGKSPMGRIGTAEEVAGVVAFLLSDASTYVTGQNIAVDGGWTCW